MIKLYTAPDFLTYYVILDGPPNNKMTYDFDFRKYYLFFFSFRF